MGVAKKVLVVIVSIYVLILLAGFLLPKQTEVSRSVTIEAPQALVFELVSNHRDFMRWSPWAKKDPDMEVRYEGPAKGEGAKALWNSTHPEVGKGEFTYTEYQPNTSATLNLKFEQGGGDARFILTSDEDGATQVEWVYTQENHNVFARYFGYFLLEGMLAPEFESGLQNLKSLAESLPPIRAEEVSYRYDGVELTGYWVEPLANPNAPIVLVVHEWWGHNAYVRKRAAMLAELGYRALAIDMYGDGKLASHPADAKAFMSEVMSNQERLFGRFEAAMAYAQSRSSDNTPMAAIGYCFGGSVVLKMARANVDLEAVVSFHGGLGGLGPISEDTVPALVLNGAADPFVPEEQLAKFEQEMQEAGAEYELVSYPNALHGFTSPGADEFGAKFDMPLAYNKEADEASWAAMQGFLSDHLSSP